ncbi:MAG: response regulator transcription factor [Acidimicrobiia bacterium]
MIRVVLVDDHPLVRAGLAQMLDHGDDLSVVGVAGDGVEAQAVVAEQRPDLVLMDISMPEMDGIEATGLLRSAFPELRVVMLTSFSDRDRILEAIDAGAAGYLLKDAEPEEIIQGIRAAVAGGSPLDPRAATALVEQRQREQTAEVALTPREIEVLQCLGDGLANKAIARRLGIAEKTVKAHLTRVFCAIGVSDRTQAVLWARDHGVVAAH